MDSAEQKLKQLGYAQQFKREFTLFSNFAVGPSLRIKSLMHCTALPNFAIRPSCSCAALCNPPNKHVLTNFAAPSLLKPSTHTALLHLHNPPRLSRTPPLQTCSSHSAAAPAHLQQAVFALCGTLIFENSRSSLAAAAAHCWPLQHCTTLPTSCVRVRR